MEEKESQDGYAWELKETKNIIFHTIDKFETRKVVFAAGALHKDIRTALTKAMEFETLYLKNKCEFYDRMAFEDRDRLTMLEGRLEVAKKENS